MAEPSVPTLPRTRAFTRRLFTGIVLLNILVLSLALLFLHNSRAQYQAAAFVATGNLATLLERELVTSFDKIDLVLHDIKDEAERQLARGHLDSAALDRLLNKQAFRLPELGALRIASPEGRLVYGAGPAMPRPISIADRDYFITLRDEPGAGLHVSPPLKSRVNGEWSLVLGRRLSHADGRFAGIVYAAIRLKRLQQEFASLDLGPAGAVALRDTSLRLIARHPARPGDEALIGTDTVSQELLNSIALAPDKGQYLAHTAVDGIHRANTYRRVGRYPFVILVGLATEDYLAPWYAEAGKTAALLAAFASLSFVFAAGINGLWRRREAALTALARREESLRESEERFRLMVEGVKDYAIYMLSPDGRIMNWNRGAEHLKQWPASEIIGRHFSVFYPPELIADGAPEAHLREAAETGHCVAEELRVRKDGSTFWAAVNLTAIRDPQGQLQGYAKLTHDITERKRIALQQKARGEVLDKIVAAAPLAEILSVVVRGVETQLPGALCAILVMDIFRTRLETAACSEALSACGGVLASLDLIDNSLGADGMLHGRRVPLREMRAHPGCGACTRVGLDGEPGVGWAEPIIGENREVLGVIFVCHDPTAHPTTFDAALLAPEAALAGIAIERSRTHEALQLSASVFEAIGEAIMVVGADESIIAINPAFTHLTGYLPAEIIGQRPTLLGSGRHDPAFFQRMWHSLETTGRWQGEIQNRHKNGEVVSQWLMISTVYDADGKMVRRIALFSDITDQKRAEEAVWQQANYDPLTLLPNRRLFNDRLALELNRVRRDRQGLTLMLVDLDHFKAVNDTLGHEVGDRLLIEVTARIRSCVRETDTVARLGGDEFTVILAGLDATERADTVARGIVRALGRPFVFDGQTAEVAGSVGVAIFPADGEARDSLLRAADRAMYAAKKAGRGCHRFAAEVPESR